MLADHALSGPLSERYSGWDTPEAAFFAPETSLEDISRLGLTKDPKPRSGRQEYLEGVVARYV